MKKSILLTIATLIFITIGCHYQKPNPPDFSIKENYYKKEFRIPMRDGKTLFTAVYLPKDSSQQYPILLTRTPYNISPYGEDEFKKYLGPSKSFAKENYIFVYQDVRGKFMSEGNYVDMRPHIPLKKSAKEIDESTDTYDTIDWLIKNLHYDNGRVGMWGISYPGFYASMGLIDSHPALKAASPQAPIADWFIDDDMHHNGALSLVMTFNFFSSTGQQHDSLYKKWPKRFKHGTPDGYRFFHDLGPLSNVNTKYFHNEIPFWNEVIKHGAYDDFWKKRNILPHLKNIKPAVLVVGGWFDAEDLYGPLHTYQEIEKNNPGTFNHLVMGPWYHGGWARSDGDHFGDINFGSKTSSYFREKLQLPFFDYYLKGKGKGEFSEAYCFDTGAHNWHTFEQWPPNNLSEKELYLHENGSLNFKKPNQEKNIFNEYWSNPANPVPYTNKITNTWERTYMIADQRFASTRPDVLVYEMEILEEPLTIAGPLTASLFVSTSGTDSDWIVKIIDVYPDSTKDNDPNPCHIKMGGYQQLVRGEIMRAKFRDDYSHPIPMIANEITPLSFTLQDIFHTFKKGHRIMVQIQSSWFPLFDRNPQKFTDIYSAKEEDFQKALQRVYFSKQYPSHIRFKVFEE